MFQIITLFIKVRILLSLKISTIWMKKIRFLYFHWINQFKINFKVGQKETMIFLNINYLAMLDYNIQHFHHIIIQV
jgi:hypothetical protein